MRSASVWQLERSAFTCSVWCLTRMAACAAWDCGGNTRCTTCRPRTCEHAVRDQDQRFGYFCFRVDVTRSGSVACKLHPSASSHQGGSNDCAERSIVTTCAVWVLEAIATIPNSQIVGNPVRVLPACPSSRSFWNRFTQAGFSTDLPKHAFADTCPR